MTAFEWDPNKNSANLRKHGISLDDARTVFGDNYASTFFDELHSDNEDRFLTIGFSASGILMVVAHTERNDTTRLISARPATKREEQYYVDNR